MGRVPFFDTPEGRYEAMIDRDFLEAMDVIIEQSSKNPWQFFLTHPDLKRRFVYYPSTGTVVYEGDQGPTSSQTVANSEELYDLIMNKINS